jgi:hypothetical protein
MHAAEILGYRHPDPEINAWWRHCYHMLVNDMHLVPEPAAVMDRRLGDNEAAWRAAEVVTAAGPGPEAGAGHYLGLDRAPGEALDDIAAERRRQIEAEGWTPEHDDTHDKGEMAAAASMYALNTVAVHEGLRPSLTLAFRLFWPWWVNRDLSERRSDGPRWSIPEAQAWKPKDPRRDLVRAGALIVAEIDRLDRAEREAAPVPPAQGGAGP